MTSRNFAIATIMALALSGGAALAQELEEPRTGFYAEPVLPDPPKTIAHVYPASEATADVASVTAVALPRTAPQEQPCKPLNPCAVTAPAARG